MLPFPYPLLSSLFNWELEGKWWEGGDMGGRGRFLGESFGQE
jgi:hypothetical protein